jgi:hypothetical protein
VIIAVHDFYFVSYSMKLFPFFQCNNKHINFSSLTIVSKLKSHKLHFCIKITICDSAQDYNLDFHGICCYNFHVCFVLELMQKCQARLLINCDTPWTNLAYRMSLGPSFQLYKWLHAYHPLTARCSSNTT